MAKSKVTRRKSRVREPRPKWHLYVRMCNDGPFYCYAGSDDTMDCGFTMSPMKEDAYDFKTMRRVRNIAAHLIREGTVWAVDIHRITKRPAWFAGATMAKVK